METAFIEVIMKNNRRKIAFRISEIVAFGESEDGRCYVYIRGDPDPYVSAEAYEHVKEMVFVVRK